MFWHPVNNCFKHHVPTVESYYLYVVGINGNIKHNIITELY